MGRHGGGSRSGGRRSSSRRGGGGSRSSGRSVRTSSKPFIGCYNRTYYNRRGKLCRVYTTDSSFGVKRGWTVSTFLSLLFLTFYMLFMVGCVLLSGLSIGAKVNGDKSRIYITDNANILTDDDEEAIIDLFNKVYEHSGMPVTLYTSDFSWKDHFKSIEVVSEELYYRHGMDETGALFFFSIDDVDGFLDWDYDMYCADNTELCLSDECLDRLLDTFHKSMAGQDLKKALEDAWFSVMDDLAKTTLDPVVIIISIVIVCFFGNAYVALFKGAFKRDTAYRYFKENPDKLSVQQMTLYSECPNCGASNTSQSEICPYCDSLLKISDKNVKFTKC